jgi:aminopeptidase N
MPQSECRRLYNSFLAADLIAIPDFAAGAMENWGLITYRESSILYDPLETSSAAHQWVAIVIAHELAHQVRNAKTYIYAIPNFHV